ncbi:MAG: response regulator [Arcobacteraceae bacterium]|nr:response regulator [Arcobacteraceae bacterium]
MANVLIVDDAKIMRITIRKILEQLGHTVVGEADSGYTAIEQYKTKKPDFVTMDITMPAVQGIEDGIEAVKYIMEFDNSAKIIMITSHGEQDKVIRAIQSGASNYMLKPLQAEKLEEIICKLGL